MSRSRVRRRITDLACRRNAVRPCRAGCFVILFAACNGPDVEKFIMTPAARIAAVIEILAEMHAANAAGTLLGRQAGQWLRAGLQRRRYAGSGDRAAVGDLFWKIQRGRARLG